MTARRIAVGALALAIVACTARVGPFNEEAHRDDLKAVGFNSPASAAAVARPGLYQVSRERAAGDAGLPGFEPSATSAVLPNLLIRTGQASIQVDSLEPALALVRQLASRVGGYVASATVQSGRGQLRTASLEVRMPADRFEDALNGLSVMGKLEAVDVSAQDVGEEFVDVTARVENAKRLEARLIDLVATRTGKLKDVLEIERELARVREEIERYDGRLRYLRARATLSTLTITVHEPLPVVGRAGSSVLGEAFKQAWRNFVALIALAIRSLGVVVPLAAVAATAWAVLRRRRRPSEPRAATA